MLWRNLFPPKRVREHSSSLCTRMMLAATLFVSTATATAADLPPGVVRSEFIYDTAPFPSCHASTIARTKSGLICAWFGGTAEGKKDVAIWVSLYRDGAWLPPFEVVNGIQPDGTRHPCWNPVLDVDPREPDRLTLYYKVGPKPDCWWGLRMTSTDGGRNWSPAHRLPDGILGPIKNKAVRMPDGRLLCPSSTEDPVTDEWRVVMETLAADGKTWSKTDPLPDPAKLHAIQPTILVHSPDRLQILARSRGRVLAESWSNDSGRTWSPLARTTLSNPNSGVDAVTLKDGRHMLIHNPTNRGRTPLVLSISSDGKSWTEVSRLETEPGEYSYPAIIQTDDGLLHATWTWRRQKIRHAEIDPAKLP
jgi:predicted neuraminidase